MSYMQLDVDKMFTSLETAAEEMAEAEYTSMRLEELKSCILAELAVEHKDNGCSAAEAEQRAKASPKYREHIEGMCVAKRKAIRAKAKYNDLNVLARLRQTQESSARTMITRGN